MKKLVIFSFILFLMVAMGFGQELRKVPKKSSIEVTNPGTGDMPLTNDMVDIRWVRKGIQNTKVKIELLKEAGGLELVIAPSTNNDGHYIWKVPYDLSDNFFKIRITAGTHVQDTGDVFRIRCCLKMTSISKTSGYPGDTFEMHGQFGANQGVKMPTLNKGQGNELIVVSWSHTKLVVKIPDGLAPGKYKTGVYCSNPCVPGCIWTSCMVWKDFTVLSKDQQRRRRR